MNYATIPVALDALQAEDVSQYVLETIRAAFRWSEYTDLSPEKLLDKAQRGEALVLVVLDADTREVFGVGVLEVFASAAGEVTCNITSAAGREIEEWLPQVMPVLETLARGQGASTISILGRPGWEKLLRSSGWQRQAVLLGKNLGDGDGVFH